MNAPAQTQSAKPIRIGIVSKTSHCKSHVRALRKEGYHVTALGGQPPRIPDTIDVVVLRISSVSHRASAVAFEWRRAGGRLIVEDGVTGVLRELGVQTTPPVESKAPQPAAPKFEHWPGVYPEEARWTKSVKEARLARDSRLAWTRFEQASEGVRSILRDSFIAGARDGGLLIPPKEVRDSKEFKAVRMLDGKPLQFFLFLLLCLPEGEEPLRAHVQAAYLQFTGKRTDIRVIDSAAWATGRHCRTLSEKPKAPPIAEFLSFSGSDEPVCPPAGDLAAFREEMEGHVLELMTRTEKVERENAALREELQALREQEVTASPAIETLQGEVAEIRASFADLAVMFGEVMAMDRTGLGASAEEEATDIPDAPPAVDVLATIDALRERGAKMTITID